MKLHGNPVVLPMWVLLRSHLRSDSYTSLIQHPDGVLVPVAHLAQDVFLRHLEDRSKAVSFTHTHTCVYRVRAGGDVTPHCGSDQSLIVRPAP